MAILVNRVKDSHNLWLELMKSFYFLVKRLAAINFIIVSLYLLFFSIPINLSSIPLEFTGYLVTGGVRIYENAFKPIYLVQKKMQYLRDLETENTSLRLEVNQLKTLIDELQSLRTENLELKKLLSFTEDKNYSYVTAKLLMTSFNPFSQTTLIDIGSVQGARVDQIIMNNEGLVGRIVKTSNNYSTVILITDSNSRVPIITYPSKNKGILIGNNASAHIKYLTTEHDIQKDEKVITSGDGKIYPPGIIVGKVSRVTEKEVLVHPISDLSKTSFVIVLTSL